MKAKILLIEDNPENRYLVTFLLEQRGHEVIPAESGPLGLELAAKIRPDLILLDIQLPGMDGHAVAARLKATRNCSTFPLSRSLPTPWSAIGKNALRPARKVISRNRSTPIRSWRKSNVFSVPGKDAAL